MTNKSLLAAAVVLVTVTGCSTDAPRITSQYRSSYDYYNFTKYHYNRDTLVEIHGNTLGLDAASFARAVTAAMNRPSTAVQSNFTTTPGPSAEKNFRVVLAFNSSPEGLGMCQAKSFTPTGQGGITRLRAAWCWSDRDDSDVTAYVTPITSIDDPRFRAMIAQATAELFPRRDENRDNNRSRGLRLSVQP
ncbi:MAG: hypothetical protein AB7P12_08280 [Alphaproteobacteria bacterium]